MLDRTGFIVNARTADKSTKGVSAAVRSRAGNPTATVAAKDAAGMMNPQGDAGDRRIQHYRKIQGRADMLWTGEFVGMIGGGALGWVAKKTGNTKFMAGVKAVFVAPFQALRETRLNNIHQLPSIYMKKVAEHSGAVKAKTWEASAELKATSLEASGKRIAENVHATTAPAMATIKDGARSGLNTFENTAAGKPILGGLQKLTTWRAEVNTGKHIKHLGKAEHALTNDVPGFFGKIWNTITGKQPKTYAPHEALGEVTKHLGNARNATNTADRMMHMKTAQEALEKVLIGAEGDLAKRAGKILDCIRKSGDAASAAHHMEAASKQGLAGMAKSVVKAAGRVPVFTAVIGLGVAAGVTATVMTHNKERKAATVAHNEIASAIGRDNALMQSIEKAYQNGKGRRVIKTSMSMVGDLANAAMAASPAAGGMGYMAASMLPMGVNMLIKENPLLNAYENLRREETHGMKLPPQAKLMLLRQLVGSVPTVAKNGGVYNRLTEPVAEAIMDQKLTAKETMQLLGNEAKFSALATEVLEKQKAASAAVADNSPAAKVMNDKAATKAPMIDSKPSVMTAGIVHEGRVSQQQKVATV